MTIAIASLVACVASLLVSLLPPAHAQDYPVRDITTVCPFAAGTGADITVRYFSAKLSDVLGKPVIVLNKAGATGNIASETVAKAKPDGYTISITPASSTMAAAPHLYKKLPFDPVKDFTPVATLASLPFVLIVDAKKPIHSVAGLIAHLKARDGGFYGGSNNTGIVAAELFKDATGIDARRVAYKNIADSVNDMIAGHTDFTFTDATWVVEQAKAGRIRALAVTSTRRSTVLPDVPTLAEAGFPGIELTPWWGVFLPAGAPQPIVDKLASSFDRILAMPETTEFLTKFANEPFPGTPDQLRDLLAREILRWGELIKLAKIEPQ
jgi:tripartite-type tricarboxylate transporter receptor subunit TctC